MTKPHPLKLPCQESSLAMRIHHLNNITEAPEIVKLGGQENLKVKILSEFSNCCVTNVQEQKLNDSITY